MDKESLAGYPGHEAWTEVGSCHVCLIFNDDETRRRIVAAYIAEGLRRGELVRYFADGGEAEAIGAWLAEAGLPVGAASAAGSFAITGADSAYYPKGSFEPTVMINGMIPRYDAARDKGYSGMRSTGEMSWAAKGVPGAEKLLEYEELLNSVDTDFPHSGMCQYDARLFDGATLFRVLQVHPYMIAQDQLIRNPFYLKPARHADN